jgi:hypothetical protein
LSFCYLQCIWLQAFLFFLDSGLSLHCLWVSLSGDPWFPFSLGPGVSFPRYFFFLVSSFPFTVLLGYPFPKAPTVSFHSFSDFFSRVPVFPFPGLQGFLFTEWRTSGSSQYFPLPGLQGSLISVLQGFVPMFSSSCSLSPLHKATLAILYKPLRRASIFAGLLVAAQTRLLSVL